MEVTIIRGNRKTVSIRINPDQTVTMRVPSRMPEAEIERILREKQAWIQKHLRLLSERQKQMEMDAVEPLSMEEINRLAKQALDMIPKRVAFYAPLVGVDYGRITIRNQRTRWGSCSSKGNLNFNCLLMLAPSEVLDYVVVHELCHRKQMNHSRLFWAEVGRVLPDYAKSEKWLKTEGSVLMHRMREG